MNKYKVIFLSLVLLVATSNTSICMEKTKTLKNDILMNNIEKDDIKISITNVDIVEEEITVGQTYNSSAIISMNVKNNGKQEIELSNIDVCPYQGEKPVEYFVSTSDQGVFGFIGTVKSGESENIKMGVTLHNTKDPIKLELNNVEDISNEKVVHSINLK